ncbi:MAG: hypothetical protein H7A25_09310 [Leptospiraceae bacterium]|nr:hypothetical protein [Leptospiraceae bacterium]
MSEIKGLDNITYAQLDIELRNGAKFVYYEYCISILVMTFKRPSKIYFIRAEENPVFKGLIFTIISFFFGWWGIPWGPIYTIAAFITNFSGGKDITSEVVKSLQSNMESSAKEEEDDRW